MIAGCFPTTFPSLPRLLLRGRPETFAISPNNPRKMPKLPLRNRLHRGRKASTLRNKARHTHISLIKRRRNHEPSATAPF